MGRLSKWHLPNEVDVSVTGSVASIDGHAVVVVVVVVARG